MFPNPRYCTIGKSFRFEAAHSLPSHNGKCRGLHGHSYKVDIRVYGEINENLNDSDSGMVEDFYKVGLVVKPIIEKLDHTYLNESLVDELGGNPTTAENLAWWLFGKISSDLTGLEAVRVWETETSWAEVTDEDMTLYLGGIQS